MAGVFAVERAVKGGPLGFYGGFFDQHDGDIVLYRVYAMTLRALQALRVLAILQRLLASRAHQDFQQVFGDHDSCIVRHG